MILSGYFSSTVQIIFITELLCICNLDVDIPKSINWEVTVITNAIFVFQYQPHKVKQNVKASLKGGFHHLLKGIWI